MAQALQLSTEEAHASDVHRAQAERLEALCSEELAPVVELQARP